jgi:glycosyl transferase family 25
MEAFVINLKRRIDRKKYVLDNYVHTDIYNLNIIDAFDGKDIDKNSEKMIKIKNDFLEKINYNRINIIEYKYLTINEFTFGELGLFVSNLYIWKKIVDENIKNAIIFEDDCIFSNIFEEKMKKIIKELPSDYKICYFGGKMCKDHIDDINLYYSENLRIKKEHNPFGTFSYIISKDGATSLLNFAYNEFKGKLGLDYFMNEFLNKNNIPIYLSYPLLVHSYSSKNQGNIFDTDIQ